MRSLAVITPLAILLPGPAPVRRLGALKCDRLPPVTAPRALANDNRTPAGQWRGDTLVVSLVAGPAAWYPEADDGCSLQVLAFAESGRAPSIPGPLIRVGAGTAVRVSIRNAAGRTLWVRGFYDRPGSAGPGVELAADSARDFSFRATAPGTYAYGATVLPYPAGGPAVRPFREDSQLLGALVVDPAGAPATPNDRILILTRGTLRNPADSSLLGGRFFIAAVNGKSWPYTERLSYAQGDSIRWRVINGSPQTHPLHLHGFYFRIGAKGSFTGDTVLARSRLMVTEPLAVGQTLQLAWLADRPGNWLFHCHLLVHMSAVQRMDRLSDSASATLLGVPVESVPPAEPAPAHHGEANHATDEMAGMIVGVQVSASAGGLAPARVSTPRRGLRLFANQRAGVFPDGRPGYGFVLQEGARAPAPDSVQRPGSTLVLRRGEPVEIRVFNRLSVPLSVHWHGLEVESYFDGVGDWSGSGAGIARPIAPGDSFAVRLNPPRSGTFMYHVHGESGQELASGLYGALMVLEPGAALDSLADQVVLISDADPLPLSGAFVNGSRSPRLSLTAGRPNRLRIIGITANAAREISLLSGDDTLRWRPLARDGAELTGDPEPLRQALWVIGPGIIADYEVTPVTPGELTLRVISRGPAGRVREELRIPMTVTAARMSLGSRKP